MRKSQVSMPFPSFSIPSVMAVASDGFMSYIALGMLSVQTSLVVIKIDTPIPTLVAARTQLTQPALNHALGWLTQIISF